jgi:hypothetical protein
MGIACNGNDVLQANPYLVEIFPQSCGDISPTPSKDRDASPLRDLSQFVFQNLKINASARTTGRQLAVDHDCRNGSDAELLGTSERASIIFWTMTWDEEPASRLTTSITSSQSAHPALNTSTLRLLFIPLSTFR